MVCTLLLALLPFPALGYRATTRNNFRNLDRITCLRQDDLDLVKPLFENQAMRKVLPIVDEDRSTDMFVSLEKLWIKNLIMEIDLHRKTKEEFEFTLGFPADEVPGVQKPPKDDPYAEAIVMDFWVSGIDILSRNWWIDKGASATTDRNALKEGQDGTLKLHLHGEGTAVWNEEKLEWEVKLPKKDMGAFNLHFHNQWFLDKLVDRYGRLDERAMDVIWPLVEKSIPASLSAALSYLDMDQFSGGAKVTVVGSQPTVDKPLVMTVTGTVGLFTAPASMLQTLYATVDPSTVAKKQVAHFLKNYGDQLMQMWVHSKGVLIGALAKYGVKLDFLEKPLDQAGLEEMLLEAAQSGTDTVTKALAPFLEASARGERGLFQDLYALFEVTGGWDHAVNGGLFNFQGYPVDGQKESDQHRSKEVLKVPQKFMKCWRPEAADLLVAPPAKEPEATVSHQGLTYGGGKLTCKDVKAKGLRVLVKGNETLKQPDRVFKIGGTSDLTVDLPPMFDFDLSVDWKSANLRLLHDGSLALDLLKPVNVLEQPPKPVKRETLVGDTKLYLQRKGSPKSLNGPVPAIYARPSRKRADSRMQTLVNAADQKINFFLNGEQDRLNLIVSFSGTVSINAEKVLRPFLTSQSTVDYGYVFHSGLFERLVEKGESGEPETKAMSVAVVSCGYLRLLKHIPMPIGLDPWPPIDFNPVNGQLELDLAEYSAPPDQFTDKEGNECLDLYTNYKPGARTVTWKYVWTDSVGEKLCGNAENVTALRDAIELQIDRFQHFPTRSQAWNYGTHEQGEEEQFEMDPDLQAVGLDEIVAELWLR